MAENKKTLFAIELTDKALRITDASNYGVLEITDSNRSEEEVKSLADHLIAKLNIDGSLVKKSNEAYTIEGAYKKEAATADALKAAVKSFEPKEEAKATRTQKTAEKPAEKQPEPKKSTDDYVMAIKRTDKGYAVEVKPVDLDPEVVTMVTQMEVNAGLSKALEVGLQVAKTTGYDLKIENDTIYVIAK